MSISSPRPPVERVADELRDTVFGSISWVQETTSTNADLLAAAREGADHGTVAVAEHQTAGRGRMGRIWTDRRGAALLVSVLLRPADADAVAPSRLVSAASVALVDAVRALGVEGSIKWPNDIVVVGPDDDAKLAGVLAESIVTGDRVEAVVVGIGCNVTAEAVTGVDHATAIELAAPDSAPVDRARLLISLLRNLDGLLRRVDGRAVDSTDGFDLAERYRRSSATIGRRVRVDMHDRSIAGLAVGVDDDGRLLLREGDAEHVITVGDVAHLRPLTPGAAE